MAQPLLTTKLYIPQMRDNYIMREEQLKKLMNGYEHNHQLTLVCAPAGYGKTTLVLEFLQRVESAVAWMSLDDADNDAQRFLTYLTAALKNAGTQIGSDIESLITEISISTPETILTLLIDCILSTPHKMILVLDDYHRIHSQKINDILKFLIEYQPPNFHLVIITREDPQLPFARLRIKDKLTEIRFGELLFTHQEANEFFLKTIDKKFNNDNINKLITKTEGWIAGLQLAALLLSSYNEDQIEEFLHKFDGTNRYLIDYLVEEVLEQQDPETKDFLCRTSILERMNDQLCNLLTGRTDCKELLWKLEKRNLFIIALDDKKEWFRYHHLFADSLRTGLTQEMERELYKIAAKWMKANGYSHEAVRYAFSSKDLQLALTMVEESVLETFQHAQLESLVEWMNLLPAEMVKGSEILAVRKAIALIIIGRYQEATRYIDSLGETYPLEASNHNKGLLLTVKAMQANIEGKDAQPAAEEALKYLEPWDPIARTSTLNSLGRSQYLKGNFQRALETFHQAYEFGLKIGYQFITTLALMNYSLCLNHLGQKEEAIELCNHFLADMKLHFDKLPPYIGVLYLAMAHLYQSVEPEKVVYYQDLGRSLCRSISYDGDTSISIFIEDNMNRNQVDAKGTERIFSRQEDNPEDLRNNSKIIGTEMLIDQRGNDKLSHHIHKTMATEYMEQLSFRETEILKLVGKGLSNQEIAEKLFISTNTTQWHLSHIYAKLGVKSRTQAILKAKEIGIII